MKNVYEILRQKEVELRKLQEEVDALRIAARLLADDQDQLAIVPSGKLSQSQMIRAVLDETQAPMHVSDISHAIEKKFRVKLKPAYVGPVIYRQLDKLFFKADKPNTFGLLSWAIARNHTNGPTVMAHTLTAVRFGTSAGQKVAPDRAHDTSGAVSPRR